MGDDALIAPSALFNPELFELTGRKSIKKMGKNPGDPEDPHDHLYLRETSRKYNRVS